MPPLILSLPCLFAAMLFAKPTPQEIAAAEPLVQEVMKAEMDALRSGKKTREQVGDAVAALAKAAQAPARSTSSSRARLTTTCAAARTTRPRPRSLPYARQSPTAL